MKQIYYQSCSCFCRTRLPWVAECPAWADTYLWYIFISPHTRCSPCKWVWMQDMCGQVSIWIWSNLLSRHVGTWSIFWNYVFSSRFLQCFILPSYLWLSGSGDCRKQNWAWHFWTRGLCYSDDTWWKNASSGMFITWMYLEMLPSVSPFI